jgi:hypothetical protein
MYLQFFACLRISYGTRSPSKNLKKKIGFGDIEDQTQGLTHTPLNYIPAKNLNYLFAQLFPKKQ